jgi:hypothetical protein
MIIPYVTGPNREPMNSRSDSNEANRLRHFAASLEVDVANLEETLTNLQPALRLWKYKSSRAAKMADRLHRKGVRVQAAVTRIRGNNYPANQKKKCPTVDTSVDQRDETDYMFEERKNIELARQRNRLESLESELVRLQLKAANSPNNCHFA